MNLLEFEPASFWLLTERLNQLRYRILAYL
jgi:hypothetical protein